MSTNETTPLVGSSNKNKAGEGHESRLSAFFHPFSSEALKLLPERGLGLRKKAKRADRIPESDGGQIYHSTDDPTVVLRIPKKIERPVKVEAKVWFANERTHNAYLGLGLLLSTIASGLLYGAKDNLARYFAVAYGVISLGILVYGTVIYERRVTMISKRTGNFDIIVGPTLICFFLFTALLTNFIYRFSEAKHVSGSNPFNVLNAWTQAGAKSTWL